MKKYLISAAVFALSLGCSHHTSSSTDLATPANKTPATPATNGLDGTETQNGGYGVALPAPQAKTVSLDLYLRGSHDNPYLSAEVAITLSDEAVKILHDHLDPIAGAAVVDIVAHKLSQAKQVAADLHTDLDIDFMVQNIKEFQWIRMTDTACLDVHDDNAPIKEKVQLAYREGFYVRFCHDVENIDEPNQAALITHEIVYAALKTKSATREFVGLIFNQDFRARNDQTNDEFKRIAQRLVADSRSPLLPDSIEIQQVLMLESSLQKKLEGQLKQTLCFGFGLTNAGRRAAVWGLPPGGRCLSGLLTSTSLLILEAKNDGLVTAAGIQVGEINSSQDTVLSVCSKNYAKVCRLENSSGRWRLIYGLPDVDDISLLDAVRSGNEVEVKRLLAMGADPNEVDGRFNVPLLLTAYGQKNDGIFDRLILAGANPNLQYINKSLVFSAIGDKRNAVIVSILKSPLFDLHTMQFPSSPASSGLVATSIQAGNNFALARFVEAGAEINDIYSPADSKEVPLISAVEKSNVEAVQILISAKGLRINDEGFVTVGYTLHKCTAVHQAVGMGDLKIARILIHAKADISLQCLDGSGAHGGDSPLMLAVKTESEDMVQLLIESGANLKSVDYMGMNALDYARALPDSPIAQRIVQKLENVWH